MIQFVDFSRGDIGINSRMLQKRSGASSFSFLAFLLVLCSLVMPTASLRAHSATNSSALSGASLLSTNVFGIGISSFSPSFVQAGSPGFQLRVNLTGRVAATIPTVTFGGGNVSVIVSELDYIILDVPASSIATAGSPQVAVTDYPTGTTAYANFNISPAPNNPAPAITSVNGSSGGVSSSSSFGTAYCSGLIAASQARILGPNGQPVSTYYLTVNTAQQTIGWGFQPPAYGSYTLEVTNPAPGGGTATYTLFTLQQAQNPVPSINNSVLNSGSPAIGFSSFGTAYCSNLITSSQLRILGPNNQPLGSTPTFDVGTQTVSWAVYGASLQTYGTYTLEVTNPAPGGGTATYPLFTLQQPQNPSPSISSVSGSNPSVGASYFGNVAGSGFMYGAQLRVLGPNSQIYSLGNIANGDANSFSINFTPTQFGSYTLEITNPAPGGGVATYPLFTINYSAPQINSLNPASIQAGSGGFTLTLDGWYFYSGVTQFAFNGQTIYPTSITYGSATFTIPASYITNAGTYSITATNPAPGGGTGSRTFTVTAPVIQNPAPAINTVSGSNPCLGCSYFATVYGSGFIAESQVSILDPNGSVVGSSNLNVPGQSISMNFTPSLYGTYTVRVVNPAPGGGTVTYPLFTLSPPIVQNPVPVINTVSGSNPCVGCSYFATVYGSGFIAESQVSILDPNGSVVGSSNVNVAGQSISMNFTPSLYGAYTVRVVNPAPGGGVATYPLFTLQEPPSVPAIGAISGSSPVIGGSYFATITGSGFKSTTQVQVFDPTEQLVSMSTPSINTEQQIISLTFSPIKVGRYRVVITNAGVGGGSVGADLFTILGGGGGDAPTITSLGTLDTYVRKCANPLTETITIRGTNFGQNVCVRFVGTISGAYSSFCTSDGSVNRISDTEVRVTLPASFLAASNAYYIQVCNTDQPGLCSATAPNSFIYSVLDVSEPAPGAVSLAPDKFIVPPVSNTNCNNGQVVQVTVTIPGLRSGTIVARDFIPAPIPLTIVSRGANSLTVELPTCAVNNSGVYRLIVTNPANQYCGGGTSFVDYTVYNPGVNSPSSSIQLYNPPLAITSVSPSPGQLSTVINGFILTINGTGFTHETVFTLGGVTIRPSSLTANSATFIIPAGVITTSGSRTIIANNRSTQLPSGGTFGGGTVSATFTVNGSIPIVSNFTLTAPVTAMCKQEFETQFSIISNVWSNTSVQEKWYLNGGLMAIDMPVQSSISTLPANNGYTRVTKVFAFNNLLSQSWYKGPNYYTIKYEIVISSSTPSLPETYSKEITIFIGTQIDNVSPNIFSAAEANGKFSIFGKNLTAGTKVSIRNQGTGQLFTGFSRDNSKLPNEIKIDLGNLTQGFVAGVYTIEIEDECEKKHFAQIKVLPAEIAFLKNISISFDKFSCNRTNNIIGFNLLSNIINLPGNAYISRIYVLAPGETSRKTLLTWESLNNTLSLIIDPYDPRRNSGWFRAPGIYQFQYELTILAGTVYEQTLVSQPISVEIEENPIKIPTQFQHSILNNPSDYYILGSLPLIFEVSGRNLGIPSTKYFLIQKNARGIITTKIELILQQSGSKYISQAIDQKIITPGRYEIIYEGDECIGTRKLDDFLVRSQTPLSYVFAGPQFGETDISIDRNGIPLPNCSDTRIPNITAPNEYCRKLNAIQIYHGIYLYDNMFNCAPWARQEVAVKKIFVKKQPSRMYVEVPFTEQQDNQGGDFLSVSYGQWYTGAGDYTVKLVYGKVDAGTSVEIDNIESPEITKKIFDDAPITLSRILPNTYAVNTDQGTPKISIFGTELSQLAPNSITVTVEGLASIGRISENLAIESISSTVIVTQRVSSFFLSRFKVGDVLNISVTAQARCSEASLSSSLRIINTTATALALNPSSITINQNNTSLLASIIKYSSLTNASEDLRISISGKNFTQGVKALINGKSVETAYIDSSRITAVIPASLLINPAELRIDAVNPAPGGGSATSPDQRLVFKVKTPVPVLTALSSATTTATLDSRTWTMTVTGQNFFPGARVIYNGTTLATSAVKVESATSLRVVLPDVPLTAAQYTLAVVNPSPTDSASNKLTLNVVYPQPVLHATLPVSPVTTTATLAPWMLTLRGGNFSDQAVVRIDGQSVPFVYVNSTQLKVPMPEMAAIAARTYRIVITNPTPGGGSTDTLTVNVVHPTPVLDSLSLTHTMAGSPVSIRLVGSRFASSAGVLLNGTTLTSGVTVESPTSILVALTGAQVRTVGNYNFSVNNPAPGGGTSSVRTLRVVPAGASTVEFSRVTTAIVAGSRLSNVTLRFRDESGNLTDFDGVLRFRNATGTSTGTLTLRRSSIGVSTATATRFNLADTYTLSVDSVPAATGKRDFEVVPATDFSVVVSGVPTAQVAGVTLPSFTLSYFDRLGNATDDRLGEVRIRHDQKGYLHVLPRTQTDEGVYTTSALQITTTGTYSVFVTGISVSNITGNRTVSITPAATVLAEFQYVDSSFVAGSKQTTFRVTYRDSYGNLADGPTTVAASGTTELGTSTASITLTKHATALYYTAEATAFTVPGAYNLAIAGISQYSGQRAFSVTGLSAYYASVSTLPQTATAGAQLSAFTIRLTDRLNNPITGNIGTVALRQSRGFYHALSTQAQANGLYSVSGMQLTTIGTYTISIGGIATENITGNRVITVEQAPVASAAFQYVDSSFNAGGKQVAFRVTYRDAFGNLLDGPESVTAVSGSSTSTIALTKISVGVYTAAITTFTVPGAYTLSIAGISQYTGQRTFTVNSIAASNALVTGVSPALTAGTQLGTFTIRLTDSQNNPVSGNIGAVTLRHERGFTHTLLTQAQANGVYSVQGVPVTTVGTYTVNVGGIVAANITGNRAVVVSAAPLAAATFQYVDTLLAAGSKQTAFRVTYRDSFGNLVNGPGSVTASNGGTSTASVTLTQTSLGVYTAEQLAFTLVGNYTLTIAGVSQYAGARSFSVTPLAASNAEVNGVQAALTAGAQQSTITIRISDRYGNRISTNIGTVSIRHERGFMHVLPTQNNGEGVYMTTTPVQLTTVGTYTVNIAGITALNVTGNRSVLITPASVSSAVFQSVDTSITAGGKQVAFRVTYRDGYGNLVEGPTTVTASNGSSTASITLTSVSNGVYTAVSTPFTIAGNYSLTIAGVTLEGTRTFTVLPNGVATVEIRGVQASINKDAQQSGITLAIADRYGNPTDRASILRFTRTTTNPASTGTITLTRTALGVMTAEATAFSVVGAYRLSVDGISASALLGTTTFTVTTAATTASSFKGIEAQLTTAQHNTETSVGASEEVVAGVMPLSVATYPNPAVSEMELVVRLPREERVSITLRDNLGRLVGVVAETILKAGENRLQYNLSTIPSGAYSCMVQTMSGTTAARIMVVR